MDDQRFIPLAEMMRREGLEAVAFVPGANFRRVLGRDFHLMERPLIVIVPAEGEPVAIVPALEMASFEPLGFPGPVFPWRDEEGYAAAFEAAANALPQLVSAKACGLEAQRMRAI